VLGGKTREPPRVAQADSGADRRQNKGTSG